MPGLDRHAHAFVRSVIAYIHEDYPTFSVHLNGAGNGLIVDGEIEDSEKDWFTHNTALERITIRVRQLRRLFEEDRLNVYVTVICIPENSWSEHLPAKATL